MNSVVQGRWGVLSVQMRVFPDAKLLDVLEPLCRLASELFPRWRRGSSSRTIWIDCDA